MKPESQLHIRSKESQEVNDLIQCVHELEEVFRLVQKEPSSRTNIMIINQAYDRREC